MRQTIAIFSVITIIIIIFTVGYLQELVFPEIPVLAVCGAAALSFLLSWQFNKSKTAFLILILLIWFVFYEAIGLSREAVELIVIFATLNMIILTVLPGRGVFSRHGLKKIAFIVVQALILAVIKIASPELIEKIISSDLMQDKTFGLSSVLLAAGVLMLMTMVYNGWVKKDVASSGAIASMFALNILYLSGQETLAWHFLLSFALVSVSVVISLYSMTYIDELTSLPGRRAFNEYTASLGKKYTLAMADIDDFKKINDRHGHDTGDEVLKFIAAILAGVESGGRAFRLGGEEFVIVFNGKSKSEVYDALETIRKKIRNKAFAIRNKKARKQYKKTGKKKKIPNTKTIRITISIGVSDSGSAETVEKVLKNADKALYKAKRQGKNRVCS